MSVNSQLTNFLKTHIEPDTERERIKQAHTEVRAMVEDLLGEVLDASFVMGSYKRHTLIRRLSETEKYDVDVMFVLNEDEDLDGLLNTMAIVAESIVDQVDDIDSYRIQKVSVGLRYNDNFSIDMVPGQLNDDGTFSIYDSREQKQVKTNPLSHIEVISNLNIERGELLKPLIKLAKRWKQENAISTLKSFHLEMLAVAIFTKTEIQSIAEGLMHFFNEAKRITENSIPIVDPVGGHDISAYLDNPDNPQRKEAVSALSIAAEALNDALREEAQDNTEISTRSLGRIYEHFRDSNDETISRGLRSTLSNENTPRPWSN